MMVGRRGDFEGGLQLDRPPIVVQIGETQVNLSLEAACWLRNQLDRAIADAENDAALAGTK